MSSLIQIKNTAISGSAPANLAPGELAINVTDGRLFYGSGSANFVKEFTGSGGGGGGTINTGSLLTTASFNAWTGSSTSSFAGTASFALTSSRAISASYALNGGVTQLLAGANITLAPTNGLGQVTISSTAGGGSSFNTATGSYGSFYDTTTQTNPVANIPRSMSLDTTDITNGVSISGSTNPYNTYIKTENAGVYNIQFSAQIDKTDSGTDEIVIWLRKNGIDLTDTATTITTVGNNAKYVAAWNWFVISAANDYYQIIWLSADTGMRLLAESISGTHPGIPSVIVTANRVDQFLSNTGSFSGSFTGQFTGSLFGTSSFASTASFLNSTTNAFIQNGNSFGATALLGTNDNQSLALETSGSTRMFISSSGRVGIGTITPRDLLHVAGGNIALDSTRYIDFGSGNSRINDLGLIAGQGYPITISTFGPIGTGTANSITEKLRLTGSGSLGLGTTSPSARFHISGGFTDGNLMRVQSSTGAEYFFISASGNVGIRTLTPSATLDVSGSARITNGLTVTGSTSLTAGQITLRGAGTTSATTALLVQNSTPSTLFSILDNGNTGIGLASPSASLHISGASSAALLKIDSPAVNNILFVSGSGRVGIGTSTLTSRLQVQGAGATSTTTALLVQNSNGSGSLTVNDAGDVFNKGVRNVVSSTFFGENVGRSTTGTQNTFVGYQAGRDNQTGLGNTLVGNGAGTTLSSSNYVTAVGSSVLSSTIFPFANNYTTAIGGFIGNASLTGDVNTFVGWSNATELGSGFRNIGVGYMAIRASGSSSNNVFIGTSINKAIGTYNQNTSVGNESLYSHTTGNNNVAVGFQSGRYTSEGSGSDGSSNSLFIGFNTRPLSSSQTNQIVIGDTAIGLGSNTAILGNSSITRTALRGSVGIGTTSPSASLHISGASSANLLRIDSPAVNNILFVSGSGRVGIGTSSPTTTLDVSGSARITNGLTVTGSLIINPTGSFVVPLSQSATPLTGSAYWSGSLLFLYNGTRYMSASFS